METDLKKEIDELKTEMKLIKHLLEQMNKPQPDEDGYYTGKQVETLLVISERTLSTYRKQGKIKYVQFGLGTYRYPKHQSLFRIKSN